MSLFPESHVSSWNRRQFVAWGLAGAGAIAAGLGCSARNRQADRNRQPNGKGQHAIAVPPFEPADSPPFDNSFDPAFVLRDFDYGTIKHENGRVVREFEFVADSMPLQLNAAISFISWSVNRRVPGPTLRATEGDRVRVIFHNQESSSHSLHFHGLHPAEVDGIKPVRLGKTFVYEFDAQPYGMHLYHCHVAPVTRHVGKGLYGAFIVDPPEGRSPADEMLLVMGGYDLDDDGKNELYAFNGIPNCYRDRPIPIYQNQLVRLYLLNMVEHDPALTFHIHANLFQVYRTGRGRPYEETDVITMGTAERHILEFSYPYPGKYMFHPHQDAIAERGCVGFFDVLARDSKPVDS